MPLDFSDPATRRYYTENYESENREVLQWFMKNRDDPEKYARFSDNYKDLHPKDIKKVAMKICSSRRKQIVWEKCGTSNTDLSAAPTMKPVDPKEIQLFLKPIPEGDHCNYLVLRKRKPPEEKYFFCQTINSDNGWKLSDSQLVNCIRKYARYSTFLHQFGRLSGLPPNPPHCKNRSQNPFPKC